MNTCPFTVIICDKCPLKDSQGQCTPEKANINKAVPADAMWRAHPIIRLIDEITKEVE